MKWLSFNLCENTSEQIIENQSVKFVVNKIQFAVSFVTNGNKTSKKKQGEKLVKLREKHKEAVKDKDQFKREKLSFEGVAVFRNQYIINI